MIKKTFLSVFIIFMLSFNAFGETPSEVVEKCILELQNYKSSDLSSCLTKSDISAIKKWSEPFENAFSTNSLTRGTGVISYFLLKSYLNLFSINPLSEDIMNEKASVEIKIKSPLITSTSFLKETFFNLPKKPYENSSFNREFSLPFLVQFLHQEEFPLELIKEDGEWKINLGLKNDNFTKSTELKTDLSVFTPKLVSNISIANNNFNLPSNQIQNNINVVNNTQNQTTITNLSQNGNRKLFKRNLEEKDKDATHNNLNNVNTQSQVSTTSQTSNKIKNNNNAVNNTQNQKTITNLPQNSNRQFSKRNLEEKDKVITHNNLNNVNTQSQVSTTSQTSNKTQNNNNVVNNTQNQTNITNLSQNNNSNKQFLKRNLEEKDKVITHNTLNTVNTQSQVSTTSQTSNKTQNNNNAINNAQNQKTITNLSQNNNNNKQFSKRNQNKEDKVITHRTSYKINTKSQVSTTNQTSNKISLQKNEEIEKAFTTIYNYFSYLQKYDLSSAYSLFSKQRKAETPFRNFVREANLDDEDIKTFWTKYSDVKIMRGGKDADGTIYFPVSVNNKMQNNPKKEYKYYISMVKEDEDYRIGASKW